MGTGGAGSAAADAAMDRYADGDASAFAEVYDALAPRLYGYFRRRVRSDSLAEDLIQQTFLHIHRARGTFIRGAEVLPWAFAIGRRLMIDGIRRDRRSPPIVGDSADVDVVASDGLADDLVHARQLATRAQAVLEHLPEPQRSAFELVRQEGFSLRQAAQTLGITVGAVKQRAHRAYQALHLALGDDAAGEGIDTP